MSYNNSSCTDIVSTTYEPGPSAISITLCIFGFVYTFFGYRCFKAVMFLSGLIFGGTTVFLMCQEDRIFQQNLTLEMAAGIAAGIGVLCGFITMLVRYVGLFLQGFFLGTQLAIGGIVSLQTWYHPSTAWIPVGILFGCGVVCAVLTLNFERQLVILATSVLGSSLIALCVDYFLEHFLLFRFIWETLMAETDIRVCWYSWVIFAVWPALSISGILLQWKVTAKGFDHTDVIILRGRHKQVRTHLVRQQAPPGRPAAATDATTTAAPSQRRRRRHRRQQPTAPQQQQHRRSTVERMAPPVHVEVVPPVDPVLQPSPDGDALPPSYFECVELGIGDPVAPTTTAAVPPHHHPLRNDLVSGAGYSGLDAPTGYASRPPPLPSRPREPDHVDIDRFAAPRHHHAVTSSAADHQQRRHSHHHHGGKRYRVGPAHRHSAALASRADTQPILEQRRSSSNRHAVAAHAQRLLAVEQKRKRRSVTDHVTPHGGDRA